MPPTADQIAALLGLAPHPTCGRTAETYRSRVTIPAAVLPPGYDGPRSLGGVLYFLLTPENPVKLHRIRSDQMYHHYLGDPVEVLLLNADGSAGLVTAGPDLLSGMRPQAMVPGGSFHAARVLPGPAGYALLGTSVWARAEASDVEAGDPARLSATFPRMREAIAGFTSGPGGQVPIELGDGPFPG